MVKRRKKFLSIIIPAFNEQERLPVTMAKIISYFFDHPNWEFEIIVVNDGSSDDTSAVAKKFPQTRVINLPQNQGKGEALSQGMQHAKGEFVLFTDADLATPIEEMERLYESIEAGCDVAIGSRAARGGVNHFIKWGWTNDPQFAEVVHWQVTLKRFLAGRIFARLVRIFTGLEFGDTQCGFKLFTKSAATNIFNNLKIKGFAFDVEALCVARQQNLIVHEIAVNWADQPGSKVSLLRDARRMLHDLRLIKHLYPANPNDISPLSSPRQKAS